MIHYDSNKNNFEIVVERWLYLGKKIIRIKKARPLTHEYLRLFYLYRIEMIF